MARILKGKEVADALTAQMQQDVEELKAQGVNPTLCIFRVGERPDDLSYERGATKRAQTVGIEVKNVVLPVDVTQEAFDEAFKKVNEDDSIHGILLFRPLPKQLDNEKARQMLDPAKDIDGCTDLSLAGVFTNTKTGFPPCTAQAAMEILHHFGIQIKGKKAAVIGRSLVIGRPVAMMLMHENATVVNCHTRTVDVPSITREADILIAASGQLHSVTREYTNPESQGRHLRRCGLRGRGAQCGGHHSRAGRCGKRDDLRADRTCRGSGKANSVIVEKRNHEYTC